MPGIRTELVFEEAQGCPVAAESETAAGPVTDVTWSERDGTTVEQVSAADDLDFDPVFDYGSHEVYEFERETEDCVCEVLGREVGPITDVHAADGALHVTLHMEDIAALRDRMSDLREQFGTVRIEYLVQGREEAEESEVVPVDLRQLTDRQREVVETAYEMGYFEYPRESNATEVAAALDIQPSTFTEHLTAAQGKLLAELVA
jgi:hypothetical protein